MVRRYIQPEISRMVDQCGDCPDEFVDSTDYDRLVALTRELAEIAKIERMCTLDFMDPWSTIDDRYAGDKILDRIQVILKELGEVDGDGATNKTD